MCFNMEHKNVYNCSIINYKWSFNQIQNPDLLFCAEKQLKRWYNLITYQMAAKKSKRNKFSANN